VSQLDLFNQPRPDPARPHVGRYHRDGPATERTAAAMVAPRSGTQRAQVLDALRDAGELGVTDYELWDGYGIGARPHVPGTRREELIADGWPIRDSGARRRTDTGSPAIVWRLYDD
jgi:hypothetical protein